MIKISDSQFIAFLQLYILNCFPTFLWAFYKSISKEHKLIYRKLISSFFIILFISTVAGTSHSYSYGHIDTGLYIFFTLSMLVSLYVPFVIIYLIYYRIRYVYRAR